MCSLPMLRTRIDSGWGATAVSRLPASQLDERMRLGARSTRLNFLKCGIAPPRGRAFLVLMDTPVTELIAHTAAELFAFRRPIQFSCSASTRSRGADQWAHEPEASASPICPSARKLDGIPDPLRTAWQLICEPQPRAVRATPGDPKLDAEVHLLRDLVSAKKRAIGLFLGNECPSPTHCDDRER